ncbi:MAG TPA: cytochrome c3 family protein [Polyangiaceae bacterium]|nr:MAG: High-molecular-weight cytochrome c precursor [Deltaproteobacteria bacterium ADurb.Bin207]HNS96601.1 cytochrome c3 family protein [Polyangiaceae bacterium]HNZ20504.1 cytochrome c3 family protein [Polyangiaceae bacterium]HOD22987.1 cytochrome c3 family protein [Polyangiaceae bacterium]HOE49810.1 cytochrome c3 family protein [Polyangiaceae bacterium]
MRISRALTANWMVVVVIACLAVLGCSDKDKPILGPSTIVLRLSPQWGALDRPAVDFDHAKHTDALGPKSCVSCHTQDSAGVMKYAWAATAASAKEAMNTFHDGCLNCHQDRASKKQKTGPVACGSCHAHAPGTSQEQAHLRFDQSLHHRHEKAEDGKCETCHHVWDKAQGKFLPKKGEESACADCHGAKDEGRVLSLQHASHDRCVQCHLQREEKQQPTGPTLCVGCHDAESIAAIKRVDPVPRLMRGQPNHTWIHADGATAAYVPFDHAQHEAATSRCSSCHHKTMRACKDCHTLTPTSEGGYVSLERAYHEPSSTFSCVGCHKKETQRPGCVGCHQTIPGEPREASCTTCHAGPTTKAMKADLPEPTLATANLEDLPPTSAAFPATLRLEYFPGGDYGPADLPHKRIVEHLDREVRKDKMATRFHGTMETLCAGCHHHSPVGVQPPKCVSCHPADADLSRDRPGLKVALHRQCILCHQPMGIKAGCVDCHAENKEQKP